MEEDLILGNSGLDGLFAFMLGGLFAFIMAFLVLFIIIGIAIYVYLGFAFMAIGRKAKLRTPALAWIPGLGPLIIAYQSSKMHWWPWLLLIGLIIPFVNFFAALIFVVFAIIWYWKMFEAVNKPGWWVLLGLIPFLGGLILLILFGVAAWSKD